MSEITRELEQQIRRSVNLGNQTAKGFYNCLCPHCKDTQWGRSGFKFEDDSIIYNCFRAVCDATCVFREGEYVSKKFRRLMDEIGVEIPAEALFQNRKTQQKAQAKINKELYEPITPKAMDSNPTKGLQNLAEISSKQTDHLMMDRGIHNLSNFWEAQTPTPTIGIGTIGIDCWYYGKRIGWITYSKDQNGESFYRIDRASSDGLLYLPTGEIPDSPLVVEGVFDAHSVPYGVGVLHNHISKEQAYLLKDKNPILLPDRTGSYFFDDAKKYGWRIAVPTWKYKDANEATDNLGQMEVAKRLSTQVYEDHKMAEIAWAYYHQM